MLLRLMDTVLTTGAGAVAITLWPFAKVLPHDHDPETNRQPNMHSAGDRNRRQMAVSII